MGVFQDILQTAMNEYQNANYAVFFPESGGEFKWRVVWDLCKLGSFPEWILLVALVK